VFTARYALSPYIEQIRSVFKGLISLRLKHHQRYREVQPVFNLSMNLWCLKMTFNLIRTVYNGSGVTLECCTWNNSNISCRILCFVIYDSIHNVLFLSSLTTFLSVECITNECRFTHALSPYKQKRCVTHTSCYSRNILFGIVLGIRILRLPETIFHAPEVNVLPLAPWNLPFSLLVSMRKHT
jgi:hypothetical protein